MVESFRCVWLFIKLFGSEAHSIPRITAPVMSYYIKSALIHSELSPFLFWVDMISIIEV
jgi:hypothetical protein